MEPVEKVIRANVKSLLAIKGVVGVAPARRGGKDVINILVERLDPSIRERIQGTVGTIGGYDVVMTEVGSISAQRQKGDQG